MKKMFYAKLAANGISKNKKTYIPYILTCSFIIAIFYILSLLSHDNVVRSMKGGDAITEVLGYGTWVVAIFSMFFLLYSNSFLIRQRTKEFGLYNILGMGKANIIKILAWESLIVFISSLISGLIFGIAFSKLAGLAMVKLIKAQEAFEFIINPFSIFLSLAVFFVVFVILFLNNIRQIRTSSPIELINNNKTGEKPPKANKFVAIIGVIALICAYFIALKTENPIDAVALFFFAVILVIFATYLLFIAGSVVLCRSLQKNKKYYYKTNHFVSVSSMVYRMKKNGAGLATICILCTAVLVIISSTACLFFGKADMLKAQFPRDFSLKTFSIDEETIAQSKAIINNILKEEKLSVKNELQYRYIYFNALLKDDNLSFLFSSESNIKSITAILLDDYNKNTNSNEVLNENEILLHTSNSKYEKDSIIIEQELELKIKKTFDKFENDIFNILRSPNNFLIVVKDETVFNKIKELRDATLDFENDYFSQSFYGFDLECDNEKQISIFEKALDGIAEFKNENETFPSITVESSAYKEDSFFNLYSGLFFLGIMLGIVFIMMAVLIMYYKQITEGFEDQNRFKILQNVGMTKSEVKKSINSQVLTVFFLPLVVAGIHIIFAFKPISKILIMFGLVNSEFLAVVTLICFIIFAICYTVVYFITSKSYYSIVSEEKE